MFLIHFLRHSDKKFISVFNSNLTGWAIALASRSNVLLASRRQIQSKWCSASETLAARF
jgi:hypothetical protein